MALPDLDPLTGMPKRSGTTTGYTGIPSFNATTAPGSTGTTGTTGFTSTAGTGTTTLGGASDPYRDIIENDPWYKQTFADLTAQGFADDASAKAMLQSGVIRFGEAPTGLDPAASGWIDETTRNLAAQNTAGGFSTVARLAKANKDQTRAVKNMLAARGALRSGELGFQLGEENTRYGNAQYDARLQLTDYIGGIQRGLVEGQRARAAQQAAAASAAAGRGVSSGAGGGGGGGGGTTTPPPNSEAPWSPIANIPSTFIANEPAADPTWLAEQRRLFQQQQRYQSGRGL